MRVLDIKCLCERFARVIRVKQIDSIIHLFFLLIYKYKQIDRLIKKNI
jgi:hypothetical protein